MHEEGSSEVSDMNTSPYAYSGGSLPLSGPALIAISQAVLNKGVPFRFLAPGFSMSPFIRDGDIVTIVPCRVTLCRTGDVVAFIHPHMKRFVVHRVIGVSNDSYRIRGDNSCEEDGYIPYLSIIGLVIKVERSGKLVRFGLGPERKIIAWLSRHHVLSFVLNVARAIHVRIQRFS